MRSINIYFMKDSFIIQTLEGADNYNCDVIEMNKYNHNILFTE